MDTVNTDDYETWHSLANQQQELFKGLVQRNVDLETEINQLRDQIELLHSGRKDLKAQNDALKMEVQQLELRAARLEGFDPIILCLLDGDGCVFSDKYLVKGEKGGKEAATDLKQHLMKEFGGAGSLCTTLYMNMTGLRDYLISKNICSTSDFDGFVTGFNRSTELFSIVDCSQGKEAADAKIREMLKTFASVPQVKKIVFGGGHDGGYLSVLNSLRTDGYGDKLVLLEYCKNAKAIDELHISRVAIPGLFLDKTRFESTPKIEQHRNSIPGAKVAPPSPLTPKSTPLKAVANGMYSRAVSPVAASRPAAPPSPPTKPPKSPQIDRAKAIMYQTPSLCNDFYLQVCIRQNCTFSHEYTLTDKDVARLRTELKAMPCKGKGCRGVKECWYRH